MDTVITRSRWVLGFFIFALSICAVRLVQLQIVEGPSLAAQGQRVRTRKSQPRAERSPTQPEWCWRTRSRPTTLPSTS